MESLDEETVEALKQAFQAFDEDGSGTIDLQELKNVLRLLNVEHVSEEQVERKFRQFDADNSGAVDFVEFQAIFLGLQHKVSATGDEAKAILRKRVMDRSYTQLQKLASYLIATQPFFKQLRPDVVQDVSRYLQYDEIEAGEWVMKQGERGDHMYILVSGTCQVYINKDIAKETLSQSLARTKTLAKHSSGLSRSLARTLSKADSTILAKKRSLTASSLNPTLSRMESLNQALQHALSGDGGSANCAGLAHASSGSSLAHALSGLAHAHSGTRPNISPATLGCNRTAGRSGSLVTALSRGISNTEQEALAGTLRWAEDTSGDAAAKPAKPAKQLSGGVAAPLHRGVSFAAGAADVLPAYDIIARRKQRRAAIQAAKDAQVAKDAAAPAGNEAATPAPVVEEAASSAAGPLADSPAASLALEDTESRPWFWKSETKTDLERMVAEAQEHGSGTADDDPSSRGAQIERTLSGQHATTSDRCSQPEQGPEAANAVATSVGGGGPQNEEQTKPRGRSSIAAAWAHARGAVTMTAEMLRARKRSILYGEAMPHHGAGGGFSSGHAGYVGEPQADEYTIEEAGTCVATMGPGDCVGEKALLVQGGTRTASIYATTHCEVLVVHRTTFASMVKNMGGRLLYHPDYLSRLLDKVPAERTENDVLKLSSILINLPRFADVPKEPLEIIAKHITHEPHPAHSVVVKQGDDGDCMYIILQGSCDVHINPEDDGIPAKGAGPAKGPGPAAALPVDAQNSIAALSASVKQQRGIKGSPTGAKRSNKLLANILAGGQGPADDHSTSVNLLERQFGPVCRRLDTGAAFGEVSLAARKMQKRTGTVVTREACSLIRISKETYQKTLLETQLKATAEKLAFFKKVAMFDGTPPRVLTQMHFLTETRAVPRGHVLCLEGQPPVGLFFIATGQVTLLARLPASARLHGNPIGVEDVRTPRRPANAADGTSAASAGIAGTAGGRPATAPPRQQPRLSGCFHEVAIMGPADTIGEDALAAGLHQFTAVAATDCTLLWLKPQELHMMGAKAMQSLLQYSKLRGSWRMKDRRLVWQSWGAAHRRHLPEVPQLHAVGSWHPSSGPAVPLAARTAAALAAAHAPLHHTEPGLSGFVVPITPGRSASPDAAEPAEGEGSQIRSSHAAPEAAVTSGDEDSIGPHIQLAEARPGSTQSRPSTPIPSLPPPSETQQDIADFEAGCLLDGGTLSQPNGELATETSFKPEAIQSAPQITPKPGCESTKATLRAMHLQLSHFGLMPQAGVMSKMQYLQSVLDGPAYWSVGAACIHRRSQPMAKPLYIQVQSDAIHRPQSASSASGSSRKQKQRRPSSALQQPPIRV